MSAFIDSVMTSWGDTEYARSSHFDKITDGLNVKDGISESHWNATEKDYTMSVSFAQIGRCTTKDHKHLQSMFVDRLKDQIYGEARAIEGRLVRAFYERDRKALESALMDLHVELR